MKRSPINRSRFNPSFGQRTWIVWVICCLFLLGSSRIFASLEPSGGNVGTRALASATAWDTQSVLGANESGCTDSDFTPAATSPEATGDLPVSVAVGDFNLDGKPDLATANSTSNNITILMGNGMGDFTPAGSSPEATSAGPLQIVVSDFNLDGKPDLASVSHFNKDITILLGNGTGDFSQAGTETLDENPVSLAVGDFNLDGRPDLATANSNENNVTILLGNGQGDFSFSALVPAGSSPQFLTVGDFNRDGRPDLAVANGNGNNVTILLGNGVGAFSPATTSPEAVGTQPSSLAVGDFNLDGKPDLATANAGSNNVTILIGDGAGNFTAAGTSPEGAGTSPFSVAVGDFNLDGKPDLATANTFSHNVTILIGTGTGDFTAAATSPEAVGLTPSSVVVEDFNLDGRPDLATSNNASNNVTILLNSCGVRACPTNFTAPDTSPEAVGNSPQSVAVGDFNLDGKPDLATANDGSNNVTILLGDSTGNFSQPATSPEAVGSFPESVAVGDFNLDGKPDLVTANSSSNNVTILLGDGTGNFTAAAISPAVGNSPNSVAVGDFNLDGKPDLVTTNGTSSDVTILLGDGTGNFSQGDPLNPTFFDGPTSVGVADFNRDGKPDLAVSNSDEVQHNHSVRIALGNGMGQFPGGILTLVDPGSSGTFSLAVGDFNLDGKPDVAATNFFTNTVSILLGRGNGDFDRPATTPEAVGSSPRSLAVGDFNLDGKPDLATANLLSNNVTILLGDGTGNFTATPTSPQPGTGPFALAVQDLDLDGRPDVATANNLSNNVTILLATCGASPNITALAVSQEADTTSNNKPIATVSHPDQPLQTLVVTISSDGMTFSGSASLNGVMVSNIAVDSMGNVTATVAATCTATTANFTLKVADTMGATSTATLTVTVTPERVLPMITCPANISVTTANACEVVTYPAPTPSDNCTLPMNAVVCTPASGSCFPVGTNTVTCTVTDAANNSANCTFTVTVSQCTIQCPANITQNTDPNQCQAVVNYQTPMPQGCGTITCTPASGSTFPKGTTTVNCATQAGPSCSFTVTVNDMQNPSITCPANVTQGTASNQCSAVVNYTNATATDNCSGVGTPVCTPASGTTFQKGTTTVNCTVSDAAGNQAGCSFTVTVNDMQNPSITCPANVTQGTASNQCSAVVNYTNATATDNCSGVGTPVCTPASGTTFQKGTTTVNCTVSDAAGNQAGCSFTVTVNDTQNPSITCPANITKPNDPNQCGAIVTYANATAADNCPGVGTPSCSPVSGSSFPVGTTTVNCSVSDASGNQGTCSFTVKVNDAQAPSITCPGNITQSNDPNQCAAAVNYPAPTVMDNCNVGSLNPVCNPPAGSAFPKGTTTVNCTVSDPSNNQSNCSFTVTVLDTQLPAITCPANVTKSNDPNQCGAAVNYPPPNVSDNCTGVGSPMCLPASGSFFPVGTTTVSCSVSDATTCENIFAVDTGNNLINFRATLPGTISSRPITGLLAGENLVGIDFRPATGQLYGLAVNATTARLLTINLVSGATLQVGTGFTVSGTDFGFDFNPTVDRLRITSDAEMNLSVNPNDGVVTIQTPLNPGDPNLVGSAYTNNFVGATTTTLYGIDSATDMLVIQNPPASGTLTNVGTLGVDTGGLVGFDISQCGGVAYAVLKPNTKIGVSGLYTINLTAGTATLVGSIGVGNTIRGLAVELARTSTCSFTVTVNDTQPPVITCPANQTAVTDTVNDACKVVTFTATVGDNCPGTTIVCNPTSGSCFPVGVTTVTCTATDQSGNTSTCSFTVTVFDGRLQDDSAGCNNSVLFNTLTGDYRWCCQGTIFTGRGEVTRLGNTVTIQHNPGDRRVLIKLSGGSFPPSGTATLQSPPGTLRCVITDRDTRNDTCVCGG